MRSYREDVICVPEPKLEFVTQPTLNMIISTRTHDVGAGRPERSWNCILSSCRLEIVPSPISNFVVNFSIDTRQIEKPSEIAKC